MIDKIWFVCEHPKNLYLD